MEVKEKIVSEDLLRFKKELYNLLNRGKFDELFEAIDGSEWKYDKAVYLRLKQNFMRGVYDIDFTNRLSVFVSTLEDKLINNNLIEDDKLDINDISEKIKRLKFNISLLKILDFSFWFACIIMITGLSTTLYSPNFISFTFPILILSLAINIIVLISAFLPPLIIKYSSGIYQFLVPIAALRNYSIEESEVIEKAKDSVILFAVFKENATERLSKFLIVGLIVFSPALLKEGLRRIKNQPTIQTYIYSPSFDSLLQNDKKVYQYVDSLVQKHKK